MSKKKGLNKTLPPNASKGQKKLAEILEQLFCRNGVDFTLTYEQPLSELADPDVIEEYSVNGMSVDFYIKELKLAVEYQGIQHYQEDGSSFYSGQMERDVRKKYFLQDVGIRLIEIPYDIGLNFLEADFLQKLEAE
jgi:hypothetical protein